MRNFNAIFKDAFPCENGKNQDTKSPACAACDCLQGAAGKMPGKNKMFVIQIAIIAAVAFACSGCGALNDAADIAALRFNKSYASPAMKNLDNAKFSLKESQPHQETVTLILDMAGVRQNLPKFLLPHGDGFYILKPQPNLEPISLKEFNDYISKGWALTAMIENPDSTYTVTFVRLNSGQITQPQLDRILPKK